MTTIFKAFAALAAGATICGATMAQAPEAPADDPYIWLEEVEGERALDWVREQNARSLEELEGDARFAPMFEAAKEILNSDARIPYVSLRGETVYNFWQDAEHVRGLWRRASLESYLAGAPDWDVILDVDALAEAEDENWVYKGVECLAPDYDRCMVQLSRGGSDASVHREFLISEKAFVDGGFVVPEGKSGLGWIDEDTLLVGAETGAETTTDSGYPIETRVWARGTALAEAPVLKRGENSDVGVWPFAEVDGGRVWAGVVRAVTFFETEYYLRAEGGLKRLSVPLKSEMVGAVGDRLVFTLQEDWSTGGEDYAAGAVVALDPETDEVELVFAPSGRQAVEDVSLGESAVYVTLLDDIVGKVRRFEPARRGWRGADVALPDGGVLSIASVNADGDDFFANFEDPTTPDSLYYVSAKGEAKVVRETPAFFDAEGVVVRQHEATSKDGTKVPYFVIGKEEVLEAGPAATVQYGYGGFQISILPTYSAVTGKLWIEKGGVYVIANIRGGGEFGPAWHQAALKENRWRAYEDFFAVSEDLIARKITTAEQLGALGGSNGGLLMGVAFTQRPDLYEAIGCGVPLLDMMRFHKLLAGASWVGEYGSPEIPAERENLLTFSPYQNLEENADYPRVFFFTSTKDDRVHPGHARKTAKKMEAMGHPFLYYENIEGGHAASANQNQLARRIALQYVYFARQLMDG